MTRKTKMETFTFRDGNDWYCIESAGKGKNFKEKQYKIMEILIN